MELIPFKDYKNKNKVEEYINNHINFNAFQSVDMYRVYEKTKNYSPIFLICTDDNNRIVGTLLGVIQSFYIFPVNKIFKRLLIIGGPLVEDEETLCFILSNYGKYIYKTIIYTEIRNLFRQNYKDIYALNNFIYEEHLDIEIDLSKSEEELWKNVHSKRRNEINKAIKEKLNVKIIDNKNDLIESYKILKEVYKRKRLPLSNLSLFTNSFDILNNYVKLNIFGAFYEEILIGVLFLLCYNDSVYNWYAGSKLEYIKKNPNDLLPWEVIKWAKKNGYKKFYFGGAGKPNIRYSVREYKKKFGGNFINYGRYIKTHNKLLFDIIKKITRKS